MKRCLVLDLNGVLWHKINGSNVIFMKGVHSFLRKCSGLFDAIGVYSSTTAKNTRTPLKKILAQTKLKLMFIWTREKTEPHPNGGYLTYKPITKLEAAFPGYNFVLLDDEVNKMYTNLSENYYIVQPSVFYTKVLNDVCHQFDDLETMNAIQNLYV